MRILHIDSSIQGQNSASRALSAQIVGQLAAVQPGAEITYRDLATAPMAHISVAALSQTSNPVLEEFLDADVVVIGARMYNFGLPSQLKA
jgi:FMN-dependent NADH-azoreductase